MLRCILSLLMIVLFSVSPTRVRAEDNKLGSADLKELAKRILLDDIELEVDKLLARKQSYRSLKTHKALAACLSWPSNVEVWNYNYDNDDLDDARKRALASCEAHNAPDCMCRLVYADDAEVLQVPDQVVANYLEERVKRLRPMAAEPLAVQEPDKDAIEPLATILVSKADAVAPTGIDIAFPLAAPRSIRLEPRECNFSYACLCSGTLRLGFTKLPASSTEVRALKDVSEQGYTQCFDQKTDLLGKPLPVTQHFCRYVTSVGREASRPAPASIGPSSFKLLSDVGYRPIDRLWVESTIPVDENHVPIAQPIESSVPILVETGGEFFAVSFSPRDTGEGCALSATYSNLIFNGYGCAEATECLSTAVSNYMKRLSQRLSANPISATLYTASPRPPGEYWFRRERLASEVLGGSPMRENSTYVVKWWRPSLLLGGRSSQEADQGSMRGTPYIYVDITSEVLIAVGNDRFHDASDAEMPKFEGLVRAAGWEALKLSCDDVQGVMEGDTCRLK